LLERREKVLIYDNFSFGSNFNIKEFRDNKDFRFIKDDILNQANMEEALLNFKPDIIIHLAALHFIPYCNSHPLETIQVNVNGTYGIIEAAIKTGVSKILIASSGAIYKSEDHELTEDFDLPKPVDTYGISKLLCENICEYFSRKADIHFQVMRFFNTYGPYETNEHLIPDILKQLHHGDVLKLGNLKTKRDYIFTEDIAKAIVELSYAKKIENFNVVNIGSGKEYSGEELIEKITEIINRKIEIQTDQTRVRTNDKMNQIASLKKIKSQIDWEPEHSIEEGLKKLLKFEKLI